jgi:hypothetical protein
MRHYPATIPVTARFHSITIFRHNALTYTTKMSWALLVSNASGLKPQLYPLRKDSIAYIVLNKSEGSVGLVHELPDPSVYAHLGQISLCTTLADAP